MCRPVPENEGRNAADVCHGNECGIWKEKTGSAQMISEISGKLEKYNLEITNIDKKATDTNKGMELKVTDDRLIELSGGIVQGTSGSPIIQDGKIIGAVTHVFVDDPTGGYGICIDEML